VDVWAEPDHQKQLAASYAEQSQSLDAGAGRAWARLHGPVSISGGVRTLVEDFERSKDQAGDIQKRTATAMAFYRQFHEASGPLPSSADSLAQKHKYDEDQRAAAVALFAGTFGGAPSLQDQVRRRAMPKLNTDAPPAGAQTVSPDKPFKTSANRPSNMTVTVLNNTGGSAFVQARQAVA
jgi:hypothetical protein